MKYLPQMEGTFGNICLTLNFTCIKLTHVEEEDKSLPTANRGNSCLPLSQFPYLQGDTHFAGVKPIRQCLHNALFLCWNILISFFTYFPNKLTFTE